MSSSPWWSQIAATSIGGLLAILAAVLTTVFTNFHAKRRQGAEIAHQIRLEREKLHYEHRLPLYVEMVGLIFEADRSIPPMRPEVYADGREHREPIKCDELRDVTKRIRQAGTRLFVLSGEDVIDGVQRFGESCESLIKALGLGYDEYMKVENRLREERRERANFLLQAIRDEMGPDSDEILI
ncbi:hypothetical protein ABT324_00640 [Saccharopolyspora sp. NPDC000359]|uniref:hypothetical protein n=1 Tax=Saccharopolyspora sp. NPDC000359 TaxID=3154251 RepID=UPI003316A482